jgi:hypothetical protein
MFSLSRSADKIHQNILFDKHNFAEDLYKFFMETLDSKGKDSDNLLAFTAITNFCLY